VPTVVFALTGVTSSAELNSKLRTTRAVMAFPFVQITSLT
jgi:hypothetical protein